MSSQSWRVAALSGLQNKLPSDGIFSHIVIVVSIVILIDPSPPVLVLLTVLIRLGALYMAVDG